MTEFNIIKSNNQSGGITAHTVNINTKKERHITDKVRQQIDGILEQYPNRNIKIVATMGDPESFQYANELKIYLETKGRIIGDIARRIELGTPSGQLCNVNRSGEIEFFIGHIEN